MPFDPAMAGIAATGITKMLDTNMGDKIIHHTANRTMQDTRHLHNDEFGPKNVSKHGHGRSTSSSSPSSSQSRTTRRESPAADYHDHKREKEEKPWSRKSYWQSSKHQQKPSSNNIINGDSHNTSDSDTPPWSKKSYWRSSRHQQKAPPFHPSPPQHNPLPPAPSSISSQDQRKRDEFRQLKHRYVPPAAEELSGERSLHWEPERLNEIVGSAVREATRRSSSRGRRRASGDAVRGGHF